MSETLTGKAMTDAELAGNDFGEEAGSGQTRIVLPSGFYPVTVNVESLEPSKKAGTPGLALLVTVNEGPFKGESLNKYDSTVWLTPGRPASDTGRKPTARTMFGMLAHMCRAVTGNGPDYTGMAALGYVRSNGDAISVAEGVKEWFFALSPEERVGAVKQIFRTDAWEGQNAVASVTWITEERLTAEGTPFLNEQGEQVFRDKNQIKNFYATDDEANGLAQVRKREFPKQELTHAEMFNG